MSDLLNAWSLPQRDELLVSLLSDHSVEIVQTNAAGEESGPVRIESWDLPELIELLEQARRYKVPESKPILPASKVDKSS